MTAYQIEYKAVSGEFVHAHSLPPVRENHYSWVHENLAPGTYRYRIRAVDPQGTLSLGPVREVSVSGQEPWLYPNPARDEVQVVNTRSWRITDMQGRLLMEGVIPDGLTKGRIPIDWLPSGIYLYEIKGDQGAASGKLVKNN
ncbi:MAG: T9SS type A sorting domain-containing protein [Bacteroidia bacterium]